MSALQAGCGKDLLPGPCVLAPSPNLERKWSKFHNPNANPVSDKEKGKARVPGSPQSPGSASPQAPRLLRPGRARGRRSLRRYKRCLRANSPTQHTRKKKVKQFGRSRTQRGSCLRTAGQGGSGAARGQETRGDESRAHPPQPRQVTQGVWHPGTALGPTHRHGGTGTARAAGDEQ